MKIIYDYQIFCLQKYGGISRYIVELVKNINDISVNEEISIELNNGYIKSVIKDIYEKK